MHVYIKESFCRTSETYTTLQINYIPKKKTPLFPFDLFTLKKKKENRKKLERNSVSMNFKHGDDSGCSLRSL